VRKAGDTSKRALPDIMMLTADVALLKDPSYLKLVKLYAANQTALDVAFREGEKFGKGKIHLVLGPCKGKIQE
jgi:catalase (peroxidase I)